MQLASGPSHSSDYARKCWCEIILQMGMAKTSIALLLSSSCVLFFSIVSSAYGISDHPIKILVTTFDPFDGSKTNGSQLVAKELKKLGGRNRDFIFEVCNLPVEFETASRKAMECFEKSNPKPDIAISLGEGTCSISLETRAHNVRDAGPVDRDAKGKAPRGEIILPEGPLEEIMTLPIGDMYCALPEILRKKVALSVSPGKFVCNEVAYSFAHYLSAKNVPFSFLHVPSQTVCRNAESPKNSAEKIATMLKTVTRNSKRFVEQESNCADTISAINGLAGMENAIARACQAAVQTILREEQQAYDRANGKIDKRGSN